MKKYKIELEKLKAKHAKELRELELQHKILNSLESKALPIPARIFMHSTDIWITYKVDNIKQAVEIVKNFDCVEYGIYSNGTTSVKPLIQYNA